MLAVFKDSLPLTLYATFPEFVPQQTNTTME